MIELTLLNHIGILLLLIFLLNLYDLIDGQQYIFDRKIENKFIPSVVGIILFFILEIIYWIFKIFF